MIKITQPIAVSSVDRKGIKARIVQHLEGIKIQMKKLSGGTITRENRRLSRVVSSKKEKERIKLVAKAKEKTT